MVSNSCPSYCVQFGGFGKQKNGFSQFYFVFPLFAVFWGLRKLSNVYTFTGREKGC